MFSRRLTARLTGGAPATRAFRTAGPLRSLSHAKRMCIHSAVVPCGQGGEGHDGLQHAGHVAHDDHGQHCALGQEGGYDCLPY